MPTKITLRSGAFHVEGSIDEGADFAAIVASTERPVRLFMRDVETITSFGTRAFRELVTAIGPEGVEIHECPDCIVHSLNMSPNLLGLGGPERVRSVMVPYRCRVCNITTDRVVRFEHVRVAPTGVTIRTQRCESCHEVLRAEVEPGEFLLFIVEGVR